MARQAQAAPLGRSNKRMHATRDTLPVINLHLAGGRVMRGVSWLHDFDDYRRFGAWAAPRRR